MEEIEQGIPDPIMSYGARFRRTMTMTDLAENYENWKQMQREEAKRIKAKGQCIATFGLFTSYFKRYSGISPR